MRSPSCSDLSSTDTVKAFSGLPGFFGLALENVHRHESPVVVTGDCVYYARCTVGLRQSQSETTFGGAALGIREPPNRGSGPIDRE